MALRISKSKPDDKIPKFERTPDEGLILIKPKMLPLAFGEIIEKAEQSVLGGRVDDCYDIIFDEADRAFLRGDFSYVDDVFEDLDITRLPIKVLLALFTISNTAKEHLPNRKAAIEKFCSRIATERPDLVARCVRLV